VHGGTSPLSFERTANLRGKMQSSTPFAKLFAKKYIDQKQPRHLFKTVAGLEILSCLFLFHSLAVQF